MGMKIPFTPYEAKVLKIINIFILPTSPPMLITHIMVDLFFLYGTKGINSGNWMFISVLSNNGLFSLYCSNYKNWKKKVIRVHDDVNYPEVTFYDQRAHRFPF